MLVFFLHLTQQPDKTLSFAFKTHSIEEKLGDWLLKAERESQLRILRGKPSAESSVSRLLRDGYPFSGPRQLWAYFHYQGEMRVRAAWVKLLLLIKPQEG